MSVLAYKKKELQNTQKSNYPSTSTRNKNGALHETIDWRYVIALPNLT